MAQSPLSAVAALTAAGQAPESSSSIDLCELEAAAVIFVSSAHAHAAAQETQALVAQATAVISRLYSVPDAHVVCLRLLIAATQSPARFFALQALAQFVRTAAYAHMRDEEKHNLRSTLLAWVGNNAAGVARDAAYVRNKLSVVFASLVAADFPERWPSAFDDMMRVCTSDSGNLELFMRILIVIQEEIVQPRVPRSGIIKDAMRVAVTSTLADLWYRTLTTYCTRIPRLCALVLRVVAEYVEWIDIRLVTQADFIDLLLNMALTGSLPVDPATGMVHGAGTRVALQPALRAGAAKVLYSVLSKGMDITARMAVMGVLRVDSIIATVTANIGMLEAADDPEGLAEEMQLDDFGMIMCDLLSFVGVSLITAGETPAVLADAAASLATATSLRAVSSLAMTLLATQDATLCSRLLTFLIEMVNCFAREARVASSGGANGVSPVMSGMPGALQAPPSPPTGGSAPAPGGSASRRDKEKVPRAYEGRPAGVSFADTMPAFLDALAMRFTYPADFKFDADDEDETEIRTLRDGLKRLFVNAVKAAPDVILGHMARSPHILGGDALAVLQSGAAPWQRSELILSLLYYFGEGCPNTNATLRSGAGPLFSVLVTVLTATLPSAKPAAGAAAAPHHSVILRYYECVERYNGLLLARPDFVPLVLSAMLGPTGLRHPMPAVRARTCYVLMRMIKSIMKSDGAGRVLEPYCDAILAQIADLLVVPFVSKEVLLAASGGTLPPGSAAAAADAGRALDDKRARVPSFDGVLNAGGTSGGTRGPSGLGPDDQQFLFELVGILLGASWMAMDKKIVYTQMAMTPLCDQMEAGLAQLAALAGAAGTDTSAWGTDVVSEVATWLVRNLNALAHISKGFGLIANIEPLALVQERALSGALRAMALLPSHPAVRNKTLFMLHRMVDCLDTRLVPHLHPILALVLAAPTMDDLQQSLVLVNQILLKFKQDCIAALAPHIPSLVTRVLTLLPDVDPSEAVIGASAAMAGSLKHAGGALPMLSTRLSLRPGSSDMPVDSPLPGLARGASAPPPPVLVSNDEVRARIDLQRAYVQLFSHCATHNLATALLCSDHVAPYRWDVITSVVSQISGVSDMTVARTALQFMAALTRTWLPVQTMHASVVETTSPGGARAQDAVGRATQAGSSPPGANTPQQVQSIPDASPLAPPLRLEFISFLLTTIMPLTLQLAFAPAFDVRDVQAQAAAAEVIHLHGLVALHAAAALAGPQTPVPPMPSPQAIGVDLIAIILETLARSLKSLLIPLGDAAAASAVADLTSYVGGLHAGLAATASAPALLSADKTVRAVLLAIYGSIKNARTVQRQLQAEMQQAAPAPTISAGM